MDKHEFKLQFKFSKIIPYSQKEITTLYKNIEINKQMYKTVASKLNFVFENPKTLYLKGECLFDGLISKSFTALNYEENFKCFQQIILAQAFKPLNYNYKLIRNFYPLTDNNYCLAVYTITCFNSKDIEIVSNIYRRFIFDLSMKVLEKEAKNKLIKFKNYESIIFETNLNKIKEIFCSWNNFQNLYRKIPKYYKGSLLFLKEGEIFYVKEEQLICGLKVLKIKNNNKIFKYTLGCFNRSNTLNDKIEINYKLKFKLIELKQNKCFLSFEHKINNYNGNEELLNLLSKQKRKIFSNCTMYISMLNNNINYDNIIILT